MKSLSWLLSDEGPFASLLPHFKPRRQQQQMADRIAAVLNERGILVCEAGTGTGKTFAYLVPALSSGKKVIISTGTRNLQDQLFHRDLPVVRQALSVPVSVALLKGRANYLCLYRLQQSKENPQGQTRQIATDLMEISSWAGRTKSGDIAELGSIPEHAQAWSLVTSTAENCLGQDCPLLRECHVVTARREAAAADVIIVNHYLLLADMALRDGGFGEILPGVDAIIIDEAHQLPEIATRFFGMQVSSRQLLELLSDSHTAQAEEAPDYPIISELLPNLELAVRTLRSELGHGERRESWVKIPQQTIVNAITNLLEQYGRLKTALKAVSERGKLLSHCAQRATNLIDNLNLFFSNPSEGYVRWFETSQKGFIFYLTPLEIAPTFREHRNQYRCSWVFTSATLSIKDDFQHFKDGLGLDDAEQACWDSPFDYAEQALLYLPKIPLDPRDAGYTQAVIEVALPILNATGGRAFLLFTSYKALDLAERLLRNNISFPLLVQGKAPKEILLQRFRQAGNAVLLGTSSFWEGVDVRGKALSCVIIDKLPFTAPDEPMLQARIDTLKARGQNPFMTFQLPEAIITLKQGAGRLIRDENDRGVLVLCDPRLTQKNYGKAFIDALPPMTRIYELAAIRRFFEPPG